jgi:hypothetical protein
MCGIVGVLSSHEVFSKGRMVRWPRRNWVARGQNLLLLQAAGLGSPGWSRYAFRVYWREGAMTPQKYTSLVCPADRLRWA